ncbi:MAG: helix-turn-helix domain-containing protein [Treponema sp.]|nr:helix-turn-helix domain-containing protein [Treponema sp.]
MFSVLIVDDEEPVLDSYEFMLTNYSDQVFTLAGKARTGYEALKLIYETEPNLVFMDINIPGIDGLSVIEEVHKKYPRMICVLSTAYERFDLAQRAIPLGIFAYLVKPVSKKTFYSTLEDAHGVLRSQPREDSEYGEPRLKFLRKDIWAPMDKTTWEEYRKILELPSTQGVAVMVEFEKDAEQWCSRIAEEFLYQHHCIYDVMLNRGLFLVSEDVNWDGFREHSLKMLDTLLKDIPHYQGIGALYDGSDLYRSCTEALACLEEERQAAGESGRERLRIAALRQKIGILPTSEVKKIFASVWEPLFSQNFESAKIKMVSLFTLLVDDICGSWGRAAEQKLLVDPQAIMDLEDLGAWKRWSDLQFEKLVIQANIDRSGSFPLSFIKALSYIRENYGLPIQLGDAAEHAQISASHLSRLFAEHLKSNFVDFLTGLRIDRAAQLLKEGKLSIKEIAAAAGYQDPNYFSKTFKKITGVLPTHYGANS